MTSDTPPALRIVTFSSLYPNAAQPSHGIFVENRLRHLIADGTVESRVVAPVPWFPSGAKIFGDYGAFARVPRREERHGLAVLHPRYPRLPKLGMALAPMLMAAAALPSLRRLAAERPFDLIDAHYFYPDGVAAALLGRLLDKPFIVTARGSDITLVPQHALPRRLIRWAAARADGIVTVSQALKDALVALGVAPASIRVLRNGVDLALFHPLPRDTARAAPGLEGLAPDARVLLSVGLLIPRKGHELAIAALPLLPTCRLLIAGEGPERTALAALAARLGVADRLRFLGPVAHRELPRLYAAADALVLASSREGMANVLLESLACGTPVVASDIPGNPEVISCPEAGVLMRERSAAALAGAVRQLFAQLPERAATRRFAERFGWRETTDGQLRLFREILAHRRTAAAAAPAPHIVKGLAP